MSRSAKIIKVGVREVVSVGVELEMGRVEVKEGARIGVGVGV